MKKNTFLNATLIILFSLVIITVVMMVLIGENGIINKEIKEYNDTHVEEKYEKEREEVVNENN